MRLRASYSRVELFCSERVGHSTVDLAGPLKLPTTARHWIRQGAAAAAIVLILAGCNNAADGDPTDGGTSKTGIAGVTDVDVGCPVTRDSTPCPRQPLPARLQIMREDRSAPPLQIETGKDGGFEVELRAGRYRVVPENLAGTPYPKARPLTVEVTDGRVTSIKVPFDSGVR